MVILRGRGVARGIATGMLCFYHRDKPEIPKIHIDNVAAELERYNQARTAAVGELETLYHIALSRAGDDCAQIFEIQKMMIEDEDFSEFVYDAIGELRVNAEDAVTIACDNFAGMLASMDDGYISQRSVDVIEISQRIIMNLMGETQKIDNPKERVILCSDDFSPSEILMLEKKKLAAIVTRKGSVTSHMAILGSALQIPIMAGVGGGLKEEYNGMYAVADCTNGELTITKL